MFFSFALILLINNKLKNTLDSYINIESERIVSYVINQSIKDIDFSLDNYLVDNNTRISYDFSVINRYKDVLTDRIQYYFSLIESGNYSEYPLYIMQYNKNKYKNIKRGYMCEMSFNSLFNSIMFANVGPTIPIKLSFIGDVNVNIDIKTKEYGINNVIIEIYAIVDITNKISMPIGKEKVNLTIKEPITVDIVKGVIPNYYIKK